MNKKKIVHLEVIRIIAIFCIVYNHIGYVLFEGFENPVKITVSVVLSVLCKMGVPLFFMVSGALLLDREEGWREVYHKRVLRMVEVIVLFNVIRFLYECYVTKIREFSVVSLVKGILTGNILHPYWFLYAYLSILLILPVLRIIVKNLDSQGKKGLVTLIVLFYMVLPLKELFINQQWQVTLLLDEKICYLFLGYFIERELKEKHFNLKNKMIAFAASFISVMISVWMVLKPYLQGGGFGNEYIPMLSMPLACAIFYLIKGTSLRLDKENAKTENWIIKLGNCVFGVYLIEDYLRAIVVSVYGKYGLYLDNLKSCIFSTIIVVMAGFLLVYVLKKLPILKKIL